MTWYVYIIYSASGDCFYKGVTQDYLTRLAEHNAGKATFTSRHMPWTLFYVEAHPTKSSALVREKKLKRCKKDYFQWLQHQPSNILMPPSHGLG